MSKSSRPGKAATTVVAATAVATLAIGGLAATAASASTGPVRAGAAPAAVTPLALPPYSTWIADVTAVTDQAASYLQARLPDPSARTAIVLDIDNTSLQTAYSPGLTSPATPPVLALAKLAKARGAAVFFVSDRSELLRLQTQYNLSSVGYPVDGLYLRPLFDFEPVADLKTKSRAAIEARGYTIVANIGNLPTDLSGGHAERTFKLPDYGGQLG